MNEWLFLVVVLKIFFSGKQLRIQVRVIIEQRLSEDHWPKLTDPSTVPVKPHAADMSVM